MIDRKTLAEIEKLMETDMKAALAKLSAVMGPDLLPALAKASTENKRNILARIFKNPIDANDLLDNLIVLGVIQPNSLTWYTKDNKIIIPKFSMDELDHYRSLHPQALVWYRKRTPKTDVADLLKYLFDNNYLREDVGLKDLEKIAMTVFNISVSHNSIKNAKGNPEFIRMIGF